IESVQLQLNSLVVANIIGCVMDKLEQGYLEGPDITVYDLIPSQCSRGSSYKIPNGCLVASAHDYWLSQRFISSAVNSRQGLREPRRLTTVDLRSLPRAGKPRLIMWLPSDSLSGHQQHYSGGSWV